MKKVQSIKVGLVFCFKEGKKGLEWFKDADEFGTYIFDKHKGSEGTFIPWGQFKTVK